MIIITTTNEKGSVSKMTSSSDTYMQALATLARDAKEAGHDLDSIMLAVRQPFLKEAVCDHIETIMPFKLKYDKIRHFRPQSDEDVVEFFREFRGLISDDMFDAKVKHVLLYNIQMQLP